MRKTRQALVDLGSLIERILVGQNFQTFSSVLSPRTYATKTGEATRERYWGVPVFICLQTNKREISRLSEHQTMQETLVWYIPEVDEPPKDGHHCSTHSEHHRGIFSLHTCEHVGSWRTEHRDFSLGRSRQQAYLPTHPIDSATKRIRSPTNSQNTTPIHVWLCEQPHK